MPSPHPTVQSTKQREPYYIHTASGLEPVNPKPAPALSESHSPDTNSTSTLINPTHPHSLCPPSPSRWQQLKEENEARKSREVTRVSLDEAARLSGRDQRGFRLGEEEGWTEAQKEKEARRVNGCVCM